ncbi:MAG: hypothetical protein WC780_01430 [Lentimicrobiaceae bacterium]|jgi:hypothetical protein
MKLKFLENINEYDEHAVRLNDFDKAQASLFLQILIDLTTTGKQFISLSDYEFIEPINCELTLRKAETDEGIITDDYQHFFCDLTLEGYTEMIKLIEPFCIKETDAYRILYDLDNPIDFIFSAGKENEIESNTIKK